MASLGTEWIQVKPTQGGAPYKYKAEVSVSRDGLFSITIPEEVYATAEAVWKKRRNEKSLTPQDDISLSKLRVNYAIHGRRKDMVLKFVEDVIRDFTEGTVTTEIVIRYRTSSDLTYWKTADGEVVPNGVFDPNYRQHENGGNWGGKTENMGMWTTPTYGVGIGAHVYEKVSIHRSSGVSVSYKTTWGDGDHFSHDTYLQKLNQFNKLNMEGHFGSQKLKEVPYTEEAAKFFYEAMLNLCKLSDKMECFFGEPDNVVQAIQAGTMLTLGMGGE